MSTHILLKNINGSFLDYIPLREDNFIEFNPGNWSYMEFIDYIKPYGLDYNNFVKFLGKQFLNIYYINFQKGLYFQIDSLQKEFFELSIIKNGEKRIEAIAEREQHGNSFLKQKDYTNFYFRSVPNPLKILDFQEKKRYLEIETFKVFEVWKDIYINLDYSCGLWDRAVIDYVFMYAPKPDLKEIFPLMENGRIRIYRCVILDEDCDKKHLEKSYSWTLNFSFALRLAAREISMAQIYTGYVKPDNILAYFGELSEKEVFGKFENIEDIERLDIINPSYNMIKLFTEQCKDDLEEYISLARYVYKKDRKQRHNCHNEEHIYRVVLLTLFYFKFSCEEFTELERLMILYFCVYHDIGRDNDIEDPQHGNKAVQYIEEQEVEFFNIDALPENLYFQFGITPYEIVNLFIIYHCMDDASGLAKIKELDISDTNKLRLCYLFKICKDMDGLDRVRLGDLDIRYLRTNFAKKLPLIAYNCYHSWKINIRESKME